MHRRRLLTAMGAIGLSGLAGCSGVFGGGSTPTPTLIPGETVLKPAIAAPTEVSYTTPVTATVTVQNRGTEDGTFSGVVAITEGASDKRKSVDLPVPGGETASTEVSFDFAVADTYTLTVTDGETSSSTSVRVTPADADLGTPIRLTEAFRAAVLSLQFEHAVYYTASRGERDQQQYRDLYGAPSNHVLVAVTLEFENVSPESQRLPLDSIAVPNGDVLSAIRGTSLKAVKTIPGRPYQLSDVYSGPPLEAAAATSGWLLFQLPVEQALSGFHVKGQRDSKQTPTEFRWVPDSPAVPYFEFEEVRPPDSPEVGTYEIPVRVGNTGNAAGTVRAALEFRKPPEESFRTFVTTDTELAADERSEVVISSRSDFTGEFEYRLRPWDTTFRMDFQPPTVPFGDTARVFRGKMTISRPFTTTEYTYGSQEQTKQAPDGKQFIWAEVRLRFGHSERPPVDDSFTLVGPDGDEYSEQNQQVPFVSPERIADTGLFYQVSETYTKGETFSGYIGFLVPEGISPEAVSITYHDELANNYTTGATWRAASQ